MSFMEFHGWWLIRSSILPLFSNEYSQRIFATAIFFELFIFFTAKALSQSRMYLLNWPITHWVTKFTKIFLGSIFLSVLKQSHQKLGIPEVLSQS